MIHEVDNLRSLCGDIVDVQAFSSNATRGFPVEDTVAINLRFANGALGAFLLSDTAASARSWEQTSRENTGYAHYQDEDCYLISGTLGSLAVPTMRTKSLRGRALLVEGVPRRRHRRRTRRPAGAPARAFLLRHSRRDRTFGDRTGRAPNAARYARDTRGRTDRKFRAPAACREHGATVDKERS